jgi:hypothetical protein
MMGLSTKSILAYRALNRKIDEHWVEWAASMLEQGFDSYHLRIFAGESPPFNQFELTELANKTFEELGLDWSDTERVISRYAAELLEEMLTGAREAESVLNILKDICIELDYARYLFDFYLLHFAQQDLQSSEMQWHWPGANRANIASIITDYAHRWIERFKD